MLWKHKTHSQAAADAKAGSDEDTNIVCDDVSLASMFGPFVKNYTNCLAHGQPVSRMPYPINFYYPNSSLQLQADIQLKHIDLLLAANLQQTPVMRFLCVVQYALSTCSLTKFPYKPIIGFQGETAHHCVTHTSAEDTTYFLGEQLSREPPASCFHTVNAARGVSHAGSIELAPKFNKTHVQVTMKGEHKATLVDPMGRWKEEYFMEIPDFAIRLVRMHTELTGGMAIACPVTGLHCVLQFKDKPLFGGQKNVVTGKITLNNAEIATLDGIWDEVVHITDASGTRDFFNRNTLAKIKLDHPAAVPESAGHKVWAPLVDALHAKDYKNAQAIKDKISVENGVREAAYKGPAYFRKENEHWVVLNPALCQNPVGAGVTSA